ncbi:MAG: hypothetical protein LM550_06315 [Candidatus Contendobacter sp.]|nr:hypothetical protein [Candidatus Contendobacter sp.]
MLNRPQHPAAFPVANTGRFWSSWLHRHRRYAWYVDFDAGQTGYRRVRPCSILCHPLACNGSRSLPLQSPISIEPTSFTASNWACRPRSRARNRSAGGWIR